MNNNKYNTYVGSQVYFFATLERSTKTDNFFTPAEWCVGLLE